MVSSRKAQQTFSLPSGRQFVRRDAFESTSTSTALASVYVGLKQRAEFTSGLRKLRVINLFSSKKCVMVVWVWWVFQQYNFPSRKFGKKLCRMKDLKVVMKFALVIVLWGKWLVSFLIEMWMKVTSVHSGRKSSEDVLKAFKTFFQKLSCLHLIKFSWRALSCLLQLPQQKVQFFTSAACIMNEECSGCFSHYMHLVCNFLSIEVCR